MRAIPGGLARELRGSASPAWIARPGAARPLPAPAREGWWRRIVILGVLGAAVACQAPPDKSVHLVVGTYWDGAAAEALHRELLDVAQEVGPVAIDVRIFTFNGLNDYLFRTQPQEGQGRLDLVVIPNDWLGQLADRGAIDDLPMERVRALRQHVLQQALLAVTDKEQVLAFPLSGEVMALIYDRQRFPVAPRTIDEILNASLPPGVIPFALDVASPYHVAPFVSSFEGPMAGSNEVSFWREPTLADFLGRLEPVWRVPGGWRVSTGDDLESLQLQLFLEGKLASFVGGPWLLEALEASGKPFAVAPLVTFSKARSPARALVGYQCAAVSRESAWADLAFDIGARLLSPKANENVCRGTRRLPVLQSVYQSKKSVASSGTQGFLRALEEGQFFPASSRWSDGFARAASTLRAIAAAPKPPSADQIAAMKHEGDR